METKLGIESVTIEGNIAEPKLYCTKEGRWVAHFGLAVNSIGYDGRDTVKWFQASVWGTKKEPNRPETIAEKLQKGDRIKVWGKVSAHAYIDKEGQPKASLDLNALAITFIERPTKKEDIAPTEDIIDVPSEELELSVVMDA